MGASDNAWTYTGSSGVSFMPPPPPRIVIPDEDGQPLVTVHPNGTIEYGPNYEPDDAARRFWDAMRYYMPARCSNCGHVPQVD